MPPTTANSAGGDGGARQACLEPSKSAGRNSLASPAGGRSRPQAIRGSVGTVRRRLSGPGRGALGRRGQGYPRQGSRWPPMRAGEEPRPRSRRRRDPAAGHAAPGPTSANAKGNSRAEPGGRPAKTGFPIPRFCPRWPRRASTRTRRSKDGSWAPSRTPTSSGGDRCSRGDDARLPQRRQRGRDRAGAGDLPRPARPALRSRTSRRWLRSRKFGVIAPHPLWQFEVYSGKGKQRSPERHYDTRPLVRIKALPVGALEADDCALLLWGVWPNLDVALEVVGAWGFGYLDGRTPGG